jgi:hypothetical protein
MVIFWLVFWPSLAVIGFFVVMGLLYRMISLLRVTVTAVDSAVSKTASARPAQAVARTVVVLGHDSSLPGAFQVAAVIVVTAVRRPVPGTLAGRAHRAARPGTALAGPGVRAAAVVLRHLACLSSGVKPGVRGTPGARCRGYG